MRCLYLAHRTDYFSLSLLEMTVAEIEIEGIEEEEIVNTRAAVIGDDPGLHMVDGEKRT